MTTRKRAALIGAMVTAFLSGCGGGGGGQSSTPAPARPVAPTPATQAPVYTPNSFAAASTFKDRCEVVRTGVDLEGEPFPDRPGTELIEKFWLRSWTEETYLWRDEVLDRDPNDFGDRLAYFDVLRTFAVTPSGDDKDDFHFSQPTEEFLRQRNSAPRAGYGIGLEVRRDTPPRDYRIRYVDPGTPAARETDGRAAFERGERILRIDGVDLVNGDDIDALTDGLFPQRAGEAHTFTLQKPGQPERTVTVVAGNVTRKPVNRIRTIDTPAGKVGYILFNTFSPFSSEREIVEAMQDLAAENVSDLVLDLRYNGGGLLAVASQVSYMIAGETATGGRSFERLRFNSGLGGTNPVTGELNRPVPFYDTGLGFSFADGAPLPTLNLNRVFVLSTDDTCSASEAVINGLRGIDIEVVLVGGTTCGKPFGFYPTDNCGETYYTIQFQGVNDKGFGDYADGFVPGNSGQIFGERLAGCQVADDLADPLGDEAEALLAAALTYRSTGSCPARTASLQTYASSKPAPAFGQDSDLAIRKPVDLLEVNRDMTMPDRQR
ncbi:MAG: S41 family peptidase [Parvularcula sp.]|jgi:hypothetical protein|nr:S41 family peptidase [Parvularcula sp.]